MAVTDPDRAALLITDAERIAESCEFEGSKVTALADIAEAIAATHPDRAERITQLPAMNSVHVGPFGVFRRFTRLGSFVELCLSVRESALHDIAVAVAATDPDRAERIAQSITTETWQAATLTAIAAATAATDPDRSTRLISNAERIAQSISIMQELRIDTALSIAGGLTGINRPEAERSKAVALADIAVAVAATDPDRAARLITDAERVARSVSEPAYLLTTVAEAIAVTDPARAERIAQSITADKRTDHKRLAGRVLTAVAVAVAATDPDHAERITQTITDKPSKTRALADIAAATAATDPDRAARLITDAERITRTILDRSSKSSALADIADAIAATHPDHAERITQAIADRPGLAKALTAVAAAMATTDPDRAECIIKTIIDETRQAEALTAVAIVTAATDPDRAARLITDAERIAETIKDNESKVTALVRIAKAAALQA